MRQLTKHQVRLVEKRRKRRRKHHRSEGLRVGRRRFEDSTPWILALALSVMGKGNRR